MKKYIIVSGKYEEGTVQQQMSYQQLFGKENTKDKFDLYFHWYNIIHEVAHCIIDVNNIKMHPVEEELFANYFAIQYCKMVDCTNKLQILQKLIDDILHNMPKLIPDETDFFSFFSEIWGSEKMNTVEMYGYFQLSCVQQAFCKKTDFKELLLNVGISITDNDILSYNTNENISANDVLLLALKNINSFGINNLNIEIELMNNPEIQCCQVK